MASDLGLHSLHMSHKKDTRLIWVKEYHQMQMMWVYTVCQYCSSKIRTAEFNMTAKTDSS